MYIIQAVNDIHSSTAQKYKPRRLANLMRSGITDHPVIVLSGARQVGKSTLLLNESPFKKWRYITLDDFDKLYQVKNDPESLLIGTDAVILDEVQKAPNLLNVVKMVVDDPYNRCKFILSGSANLLLMQKVSESLAGRAVYYRLFPMTSGEIEEYPQNSVLSDLLNGKIEDIKKIKIGRSAIFPNLWKGFMPALISYSKQESVLRWWEGYIRSYLERDLSQLSQVESLPDFRRLMSALALRCGQLLNQSEVSRDTGISQPTVHRYINLLESTSMLDRLPAYSVNRTKRLIKSPKIIWNDPGLVSFLTGHFTADSLCSSRELGGIFESMVYLHLSALAQLIVPAPHLYYWRTSTGKEVDFIIEWGQKLLAIECKYTGRPKYRDIANLQLFMEEYPETSAAVLLHTGDEVQQFHEKIIALPWYYFK